MNEGNPTLRQLLEACEALLRSVGEGFWAGRIAEVLGQNREGEICNRGIEEVLSWYGGMGSFADLYISQVNGDLVGPEEERGVRQTLDDLRERIYTAAAAQKRPG